MDINSPEPGTYARRFGRGTPLCAVLIEDQTERDPETGEPMEDVRLVALVDGKPVPVDKVWPCQPVDAAEYQRILDANRRAIGGNNPPAEKLSLLDEAADIVAGYAFLSDAGEKIDAVKQINGLIKDIENEGEQVVEDLHEQIDTALRPYAVAVTNLRTAKEALLKEIDAARKPGETIRGRYASAFGRKVQKVVVDPALLPPEYVMTAPNHKKIEAALKAGQVVPGCRLDTTEATTVL